MLEDEERGRFSSKEALSVENRVSPGAWGGSSRGAGIRCRAPKPRTQPRAPSPPQPRDGVMVTGRVTLYSWLYTKRRSGRLRYYLAVSRLAWVEGWKGSYVFDELAQPGFAAD